MAYGFLFDPKRCIECRACEAACKQWNRVDTGIDVRYRRVRINEMGRFPNVRMQALSISCNHCENALCAKACPVKAITVRGDGLVLIDANRCLGCRLCEKFCPYDAPQFNVRANKMQKCTGCADRVDQGLEPACVSLCPTEALRWGKWEDISGAGEARVENLPTPSTTRPRIRFVNTPWGGK
jgi:anaerobic dimethyl sulfoxide reductase subunit B